VWSQRELGVALSERQMRRLSHRLRFRRKVLRPLAVGADAALQAPWKKGTWRGVEGTGGALGAVGSVCGRG
jgi:hypothetical protein